MKILIPAASAALSLPLSAATVFQQKFETSHTGTSITNTNTPFSEIAWAGYIGGPSSAVVVGPTNADPSRAGVLRATTGPNGSTSGENAYIYAQTNATTTIDYFFYISTSTATVGNPFNPFAPSSYSSLNASWKSAATAFASGSVFFAVETGGAWYVTSTNFRNVANGAGSPSLDLLNSTWRSMSLSTAGAGSLTYNSGSSFTSSALFGSGQTITGIGFYVDEMVNSSGLATYRIDDLLISDIPETSTSLLGVLGFSFLAFRRKK